LKNFENISDTCMKADECLGKKIDKLVEEDKTI